MKIYITYCK